ncbi:site-specific DNA-methyltransferase [Fluviispira multicolorata]|uniref:Methyltransferase n=1 Tax=Fluviispira multicolorata TaxID=2654512 RepID=A0A833JCJ4_9BACT|nr:site-specific DNA-methyltransferase [Fluviispira multicolorata]KAB8030763.1 site-specific DNA-methyltransferase [Fluviispira multicolorata]
MMHIAHYQLELKYKFEDQIISAPNSTIIENTTLSRNNHNSQNMLIHGDNYQVMKYLQKSFQNKVKCIYIDPPFNTGVKINSKGMELKYHDEFEHSFWLGMMHERLIECRNLLSEDGCLFLHLDDNECAYAKILLDNIFGRSNYINTISIKTHDPSGFKVTGKILFSSANYILLYAKNKENLKLKPLYIEKKYDKLYSYWLYNREENISLWKFENIKDAFAKIKYNTSSYKLLINEKKILKEELEVQLSEFAINNARQIFRLAPIGGGAKVKRQKFIELSTKNKGIIFQCPNEKDEHFYLLNGNQILFYDKRFQIINGKLCPSEVLTNIWCDIPWNGIAREGGVTFCNAKKPESLIKRILLLSTNEGDLVLDCFLGSGTTAAVAHKMKRSWIGIEKDDQIYTHAHKRLVQVLEGKDNLGISKEMNWKGGGGFQFYELNYNT